VHIGRSDGSGSMSGFSELDLVGLLQRTWGKLLTTASVTLLTYLIFCTAMIAFVQFLQRSGSFKFRIRATISGADHIRREITRSLFSITVFQVAMAGSRVVAMGFGIFIDLRHPSIPLWKVVISFPLIFILHDMYFYWTHRIMHLSGFYRIMHREHHKSFAPTAYAAYSFAFLEAWVQGSFLVFYVLLLPANNAVIVFFVFVEIIYNSIIHSGIDPFPRWMVTDRRFGWVAGSAYHDLHHRTVNWNFGLYFRFWDRLMGTEHPHFVRIHNYIHSPENDGRAYKLLGGRAESASNIDAAEFATAGLDTKLS
jgi:Delta7-sterol 5-desaturase